ncbi:MAG: serine/threonine protein kinase [Cytophagaceae bacterium]|nr:serine/threonine protein kinase [Gemmatimonadaceae bacterium]
MTTPAESLAQGLSGRYEILSEIGRGGFATVFLARDLRHDSRVAIKVLRPELSAALGQMRFTREMQITANLQHPNILPLIDSGEANGVPYYVMPYVEGESLAHRLSRESPLPVDEAVRLVAEVADALHYAHGKGFIHRDIKPENILLSQGHAVIADFGVARAMDVSGAERITDSGMALGTVTYMSPEQATGDKIDGRADLYALACVFYETLAGSPPFSGGTAQAIMARHAVDPPPALRSVRPGVPPALETAVLRALAKVPTDRQANAGEFRDEIVRAALTPVTGTATLRVTRAPSRRNAVIATAGIVLAAIGAFMWQGTRTTSPQLDANRVMVYPLVLPDDWGGSRSAGEDVATMIGSAVDGAGPLRWIDGWHLLDTTSRADTKKLSAERARAISREHRSAYYLMGRVVQRGDSADVFLVLHDVVGDSALATGSATLLADDVWRAGLLATSRLLSDSPLIPTGVPDVAAEWSERNPKAVAHFLLAEAAFRRAQPKEAEKQFSLAVAADTTFGLAAIRGAQAATWNHDARGAASLIARARRARLSPRHAAFAEGYQFFLEGSADSARAAFQAALAMDSTSAFVWLQLGETYAHLLPLEGSTDSLQRHALEKAFRLDSSATTPLFHLIEVMLRHGDTTQAAPVIARFLAASPDSMLAREVELMDGCVRSGAARFGWPARVASAPLPALMASVQLSVGGRQWDCAAAGFAATLAVDTAATGEADSRRWTALVGWQSIQLARGAAADAEKAIDAFIKRWDAGSSLFLLDAWAVGAFTIRADSVARIDAVSAGADYSRCASVHRCWLLGLQLVRTGRADQVPVVASRLVDVPEVKATPEDSLRAQSLRAHATLAQGDTNTAMSMMTALLSAPRSEPGMAWDETMPMAAERLSLARLLHARGEHRRAIAVLDVFDSRSLVHALYLAPSLELRVQASTALGDARLTEMYRSRLTALRGA